MKTYKKWTTAEDSIVVDQVRKSPSNLKQAFTNAALEINRTVGAVQVRWYTVISKDKSNPCFLTVSGKHKTFNRKNGKGTANTSSIFTKILKLLNFIK